MAATLLCLVAAMDRCRAIGRDNALPWRLGDDLRRFKALTLGKPVLMGRKTAEALGRALPGRRNLVLTRSANVPFAGMEPVGSMAQAMENAQHDWLMVIGGGEVYSLALPLATRMHLTHVDTRVEDADAHFPAFAEQDWQVTWRQAHRSDERNEHDFEFVDYQRS